MFIEKQENKNGEKKKKDGRKTERSWAGLEPGNFGSLRGYVTATPLKLNMLSSWKVFYLMPKVPMENPLANAV